MAAWPRLILTRPAHQVAASQELFTAAGLRVSCAPLLAIEALSESQAEQAIKPYILELDRYSKLIFVSQNAVREGAHWIDRYWPQLPCGQDYFAVGIKTAKALAQALAIEVSAAQGAMNSEALLALPALQAEQVAGQDILIFRGQGGRPHLAQVLQQRGAQVAYCELYRRSLPASAGAQWRELLAALEPASCIALYSGESLQNLDILLAEMAFQGKAELSLLVPGERVAKLAQSLGYENVLVAENATDEAMLKALQEAA